MQAEIECPLRIDLEKLEEVRASLKSIFGADFELWVRGPSWFRLQMDDADETVPAEPDARLQALLETIDEDEEEPRCHQADGEMLLALPLIRRTATGVVATAGFPHGSEDLLLRLARLFLKRHVEQDEIESVRRENLAFLHQVTNDLEELAFLRGIARKLEVSDLTFDLSAMAASMLPTLRPLVQAETIALVWARTSKEGDVRTHVNTERSPIWDGQEDLDEDTCMRLVGYYQAMSQERPFVQNRFGGQSESRLFPGVDDFILAPVVTRDMTIGWLLALNRRRLPPPEVRDLPWEVSYLEFGTHEATLLSSTASMLATHSRNVELFREREALLVSIVRALVSAIEAKDEYTRGHSERVALFGRRLAEALGVRQKHCEQLYLAGLLHDVGKIGVRDAVLSKPGPLTEDELEEVRQHPDKGWGILADLALLAETLPGVLHHHEQYGGDGYPDGLKGEDIPLIGRIIAVADAYDAMTSDRSYRPGMPQERAETILESGAGTQWDPRIIEKFLEIMPQIIEIKNEYVPHVQAQPRRFREKGETA